MRICFIPIDNRPVCYTLAEQITSIDKCIELFLPPREYLGNLIDYANTKELINWIESIPECDAIILSLDTLAYGGLIPSRRSKDTIEDVKNRLNQAKKILSAKNAKIYAFSSIMRISNNNYNEEEKEYWKDYGKKIFKYSYDLHKFGKADSSGIPSEILDDYLNTRKRNFEINKLYLEWQKEGFFDTLIFSKDDCAEYGLNVKESRDLEMMGGFTKTGADEIPLTLLARSIKKDIKVFVEFTEPDCTDLISNYEDVSIEKSVLGQLDLGGFSIVESVNSADIVLIVNNFCNKQGELVMDWDTSPFNKDLFLPQKPYAVADVRFANGADNAFVLKLLNKLENKEYLSNFLGYAGWNTSANTIGTLLACIKVRYIAGKYSELSFKKLQITRFLDDWAYQANVRGQIDKPCDISNLMKPYEEILFEIFKYKTNVQYIYPWDRKFEIEVIL